MGVNQDQYITTVAQCFLRDTDLDVIVSKSKTLVNSNIMFDVQEKEIRGGEFNKLLYSYNYGKTGTVSLEDPRYEPAFWAIGCGTTIKNQASNVYVFEEEVTLDASGDGSVTGKTPTATSKAYVQTSDKSITTKSFTASAFSMGASFANQKVYVTYQYSETVDMITIDGDSFPKMYELVMEVKVWDATGLKEKVQWIFPKFKPSGKVEMPLAAETPTTSKMEGKVLDDDGVYGYKKVIPVTGAITYNAITADVSEVALTTGETQTLTVYGLRGGIYAPVTLAASSCTYSSSVVGTATVDATGKVSFVAAGTTYITITHTASTLTDVVKVVCS
jgi:hypothetical protein